MSDWRAALAAEAWNQVRDFTSRHPEYTIAPEQSGGQGNTNYVILGKCGAERVVFKYFCQDERKDREVFGLRHWAASGLVPHLLAEQGRRLIAITLVPGEFLPAPEPKLAGRTLGQATARLAQTPLSPALAADFEQRFYEGRSFEQYYMEILQASRAIHERVDLYAGSLYGRSLDFVESQLPSLFGSERILYHQDAANAHFQDSRFSGFFDLEMCRVGTVAMQLGCLWGVCQLNAVWPSFASGFAAESGSPWTWQQDQTSRAVFELLVWRYISRYGEWHGEPLADGAMAQERADEAEYRADLERSAALA